MSPDTYMKAQEFFDADEVRRYNRRLFLRSLGLGGLALGFYKIGLAGDRSLLPAGRELPDTGAYSLATLKRYYGHAAVLDDQGVIAPWYKGLNGQCDLRIRIAAETLKRYPWTSAKDAIAPYPHYVFSSKWSIAGDGAITPQDPGDWMNGDLGQRATSVFKGLAAYYRYSGDPSAFAHLTYMGDYLLDYCLTPADHPWPRFPISVPVKGKAYGRANPDGMIQLDICGSLGEGLLVAYQLTKNKRWFDAAKHWGDLFARKCDFRENQAPWPRYANPESARWHKDPRANTQTGGVTMILAFLDELIRMGYTGLNDQIVAARDAGIRYLRDELLPRWTEDQTWGYFFWDWLNQTQNCSTTSDVAGYLIRNKERFPNWREDARNIMTLFLNHSSANPASGGDMYNGAWAYPESSSCCESSLWYAPLMLGSIMAQYGEEAQDPWMRELAYRQMILQTYDVHETGVTEDNIEGGVIVNNSWFNIAHPWPLLWVLHAMSYLPEELAPSRENHLLRSTSVVDAVTYGKGEIVYSTYDAPTATIDVLRLSYIPARVEAEGRRLSPSQDLSGNGYRIKTLPNGDAILWIRHDGLRKVTVTGPDPQTELQNTVFQFKGDWVKEEAITAAFGSYYRTDRPGASFTAAFEGTQLRLTGQCDMYGGRADVFIDGQKQNVYIDCWNPGFRARQILYYRTGLTGGKHTLKVVARGDKNPYAKGNHLYVDTLQCSGESARHNYPSATGPTVAQRMIFGYKKRRDYRDAEGNLWRPATEVVTRLASRVDTVASCWMAEASALAAGVADPELYRYGYHAEDFWVNLTVGPGEYDVRLKFAVPKKQDAAGFDIIMNGQIMIHKFNVWATAGAGENTADILFRGVKPASGTIQVRFKGLSSGDGGSKTSGKAFVQALEMAAHLKGEGATPVSFD